jgi:hypothetical protein
MSHKKLLRLIIVIFFSLLPLVFIASLPGGYLLFFILLFFTPLLSLIIGYCLPQLGKSWSLPRNRIIAITLLFLAFFFSVALVIIYEPFMPKVFQEKFPYIIITVLWEVGVFMMIADKKLEGKPEEPTKEELEAEFKRCLEKLNKKRKS